MHLADAFIQSDLQCIQVIHFLSVCVFPDLEPTTFALLTQCSTTEPQEPFVPFDGFSLGVDRLSAPILSILPIIDIGHFKNRFTDIFFFFFFLNKHTIYRWHYLLVNK